MELNRVVITGLGAVTPLGNNIKDFWENAVNGMSGANMITHFNTEKFKTKFAIFSFLKTEVHTRIVVGIHINFIIQGDSTRLQAIGKQCFKNKGHLWSI